MPLKHCLLNANNYSKSLESSTGIFCSFFPFFSCLSSRGSRWPVAELQSWISLWHAWSSSFSRLHEDVLHFTEHWQPFHGESASGKLPSDTGDSCHSPWIIPAFTGITVRAVSIQQNGGYGLRAVAEEFWVAC